MIQGDKVMPLEFKFIGGPDAGKLIIQFRHYEWIAGENEDGYYRWDEKQEAYVWVLGSPPEI